MATSTSVTIGPMLWDNFNGESALWHEKARRFASDLPDRSLGQRIYSLLREAFQADQAGMYLRSHDILGAAEELLCEAGELESFMHAMAGKARPADPGDDAPLPTPGPRPTPQSYGGGPCDDDEFCEQCATGLCMYAICQSCS
ncbi:MAG: hypothetical protein PHH46_08005 [Firmicutes bacterium]|jgi:hypothetical protein|nr:hypothetical protein [Bacillota bacterium]